MSFLNLSAFWNQRRQQRRGAVSGPRLSAAPSGTTSSGTAPSGTAPCSAAPARAAPPTAPRSTAFPGTEPRSAAPPTAPGSTAHRRAAPPAAAPRSTAHPTSPKATAAALTLSSLTTIGLAPPALSAEPPSGPPRPGIITTRPPPVTSALRYDTEYPLIGYANRPTHNAIARLQERIDHGEVKLDFTQGRGYLDSLLKALGIDPSSQTLVYSKTSLQFDLIQAATPRAIYFDDDTYVAWIPDSRIIEITAMDQALGPVFYTMQNQALPRQHSLIEKRSVA